MLVSFLVLEMEERLVLYLLRLDKLKSNESVIISKEKSFSFGTHQSVRHMISHRYSHNIWKINLFDMKMHQHLFENRMIYLLLVVHQLSYHIELMNMMVDWEVKI
jgi:hypothetical protein